jgi:hypothetical protein
MIRFISYSTPGFEAPMHMLLDSALLQGADSVRGWSLADLRALPEYAANRGIFDAPRGAGYWAWKPLIILKELEAMADGDVLIYADAGRVERPHVLDRPLREVVDWVVRARDGMLPGVYIPQWGRNEQWTKGECFAAMGCDTPQIRHHPQVQASFSIWQAHARSRDFVAQWSRWALDRRAVADERIDPAIPDAADFIEHRYDQSVLTNLTVLHGLRCFGEPDSTVVGPFRGSPVDKDIGTLADRIAGRHWAIRRRLAREQMRASKLADPSPGVAGRFRRALRHGRALARACLHPVG